MRKLTLSILLVFNVASVFQIAVPFMSYTLNYEYIIGELCLSNFEPGHEDCNGYCVFRKNIQGHHSDHNPASDTNSIIVHHTYLTFLIPKQVSLAQPGIGKELVFQKSSNNTISPFITINTPPPQG